MSALNCIGCLKATIRTVSFTSNNLLKTRTIPSNLLNSIPSSKRFIHPFSPSLSLQKKKGAVIEEEFQEFEEDVIEDGQEETIDESIRFNKTTSIESTKPERFQATLKIINDSLNMSNFQIKSFRPSYSLIERLLSDTSTPEEVEIILDVLKRWRLKGLVNANDSRGGLLSRLYKLQLPEVAVDVLERRDLYGISLNSIREADSVFHRLTTSRRMEGVTGEEAKPLIDDCFRLLKLTQFVSKESSEQFPDVCGHILTVKFSVEKGEPLSSPRVHQLLVDLKEVGEDKLVKNWEQLGRLKESRVARALRVIVEASIKGKVDGELLKFLRVLEGRFNEKNAGKALREAGLIA